MGRGAQLDRGGRVKVTVVGGGLAGLSAAVECAESGAAVTLLEARPRLGGATFSIERDGLWLDNGQHVFLRCCTAYREFLARLGVERDVVLQDRLSLPLVRPGGRVFHLRRASLPAPLHLSRALARFPGLAASERIRAAAAALRLARLDLDRRDVDTRTFADWLAEHGQTPNAIARFWNLFTLPTVNLPAAEASLTLAGTVFQIGLLSDSSAADVGYANVPLSRLHADAAARRLERLGATVRVRARVQALDGTTVRLDGETLTADAVVLAVPHDDAAALLPDAGDFRRLGASPILNLHVAYDRQVMRLPFAAGLDSPVQWVFDRTASSGLERGQLLAVSLSSADAYAGRSVEELRAEFVPALAELFPATAEARVERFFVTREQRATFRQAPGTRALRPPARTSLRGVYLAGAWTDTGWPATMEGAVLSGLAAARAALEDAAAPVAHEVAA